VLRHNLNGRATASSPHIEAGDVHILVRNRSTLAFFLLTAAMPLTPALAQQAPVQLADAATDGAAAAAPAADTAPEPANGGEVMVTARRREERAQDVPIALSVISGQTIERTGNVNLVQISNLTPSVAIRESNARNTFINIRGLGSNSDQNDGLEIGVGIYVDDVYYGRIGSSQFDLIDIDRFEVLRGPQGTLFGKNTTAGAINITTRAPTFDWGFAGEGSGGSRNYYQLRGSLSGPIVADRVAFRLTLSDSHQDGLQTNLFNGRNTNDFQNFTARGQLLIDATPNLTIRIIGDYSKQTSYGRASSIVGIFTKYDNGAPITDNFNTRAARLGYAYPFDPFDPFGGKVAQDAVYQANMDGYGVSGKIEWNLGKTSLTSITAYRWWDWYPLNDQDYTSLPINTAGGTLNHQRQFSQELRWASNGHNRIDWVGGLYYFWQVVNALGQYQQGPDYAAWNKPTADPRIANFAFNGWESDQIIQPITKSMAAFGQATWNVSERLKVTGGVRFTHEIKDGYYNQFTAKGYDLSTLSAADAAAAQALRNSVYQTVSYTTGLKNNALTGQVNIAYKITPDVMIYAGYQHGSKSGGLSLGQLPAGVSPVVKPEYVDAYEIGLKSQWWDHRITFNTALFQEDVNDYQAAITVPVTATSSIRYIANIPGVRSRGVESDLTIAPSRYARFGASLAYVDAVFTSYPNAQQAPDRQNQGALQDLSGSQVANAPKFTYSLNADLSAPLSDGKEAYARADYVHRSSYDTSGLNSAYTRIAPYGVLNASIGLRFGNGRYDVSAWSRNLLDKHYFTTLGASTIGLITGIIGDTRSFGGTLRVKI